MKLLILLIFGVIVATANKAELLQQFSVGNHEFTADVYRELLKSTTGNVLICPLSAEIVLALIHEAARGETAKQIASGLRLPESSEKIQEIFSTLTQDLHSEDEYTLNSANKVYVNHGFSFKQQFKDVAVKSFNADIQNIDFSKSNDAVDEINKWVSDKTENHIKDLLSPRDIDASTLAVLVNALFFQGKWMDPFKKDATTTKPFYLNANDHIKVEMMSKISYLNYYESPELNAKVLEIPYEGDDISMTFVLPNEKEGLHSLEENLGKVFESPKYTRKIVNVAIPKFETETTIKLIPILKALGIEDAFSANADFSGLGSGPIKISQVIQKNFIEVDEYGTKAASATAGLAILGSVGPPRVQATFNVDHPFFYYIKKADIILFAGSIKKVEQKHLTFEKGQWK